MIVKCWQFKEFDQKIAKKGRECYVYEFRAKAHFYPPLQIIAP